MKSKREDRKEVESTEPPRKRYKVEEDIEISSSSDNTESFMETMEPQGRSLLNIAETLLVDDGMMQEINDLKNSILLLHTSLAERKTKQFNDFNTLKVDLTGQFKKLQRELDYSLQITNAMLSEELKAAAEAEKKSIEYFDDQLQVLKGIIDKQREEVDTIPLSRAGVKEDLLNKVSKVNYLLSCDYQNNIQNIKKHGEQTKLKCEVYFATTMRELKEEFQAKEVNLENIISSSQENLSRKLLDIKDSISSLDSSVDDLMIQTETVGSS
eukprot:TRINITY_DN22185_c0_g1_i1.p1 TRINITY_DN22185_c0_g1~~TRINITY_DN22185_c0_g1_i1.p1  ORF type:complete len:269 (+),score=60.64 TRINITY_DN22185_c0_g1_i1:139-945(+)